jgi:hypothetical protein
MKFIKVKTSWAIEIFNSKYLHTYEEFIEGYTSVYYNNGRDLYSVVLKIDFADFEKTLIDFIQDEKAVILDLSNYEYERN